MTGERPPSRRWPFVLTLGLGLGLIAAPAIFQMFDRAPKGRSMIDSFAPYMTEAKIAGFQRDLRTIDAAVVESTGHLRPALVSAGTSATATAADSPLLTDFQRKWPAIYRDMGDMLDTIHGDLGDYAAVDALPPFDLFPWSFVAPGVIVAVSSVAGLLLANAGHPVRPAVIALVVVGAGLVIAPGLFDMWVRAPKGGHMIDDFRPLMTQAKVERIQGYFLVIGAGEGTLRAEALPALAAATESDPRATAARFPAIARFGSDWPGTSNRMAPMIGAMSDNLGNYAAVDALPPFPLFPWFFVIPGVLVVGLAAVASRRPEELLEESSTPGTSASPSTPGANP